MNTAPIGEIASIRMGVTLRGRDATRPDPHGSCRMIRISDVSDDGGLATDDLLQFEPGDAVNPDYFLRPGDILFPNRGLRTTAAVFELREPNILVGAQFFILRVKQKTIVPAYLAWFLRTEPAANHFAARRKGTLVQTLQRRDIEELAMPLPALATQTTIVSIDALARDERRLSVELLSLRTTYLEHRLLRAANQP